MNNQRLTAMGALVLAEKTIANTLKARGYVPGSNLDEWEPQVKAECAALLRIRATIARLNRDYGKRP